MIDYFLQCLFIILPLVLAGVFFIFSLKKGLFKFLESPIDGGLKINGVRLFGDNKTWRGVVIMPTMTFIFWVGIVICLRMLGIDYRQFVFDYDFSGYFKIIVFALAYPIGELPNSYVKRRFGILPGQQAAKPGLRLLFDFLDLADSLILCFLVLVFVFKISLAYCFGAFWLGFLIHYLTDKLMLKLRLKKFG